MKTSFPGFYRPSGDEFATIWKECVFVFDASVLLNLYRYKDDSARQTVEFIENIQDRVWIPYHAALEYHRNLPSVILSQRLKFDEIKGILRSSLTRIIREIEGLQLRKRHAVIDSPDDLIASIEALINEYEEKLSSQEKERSARDEESRLRSKIDALFSTRVGPAPDRGYIKSICEEGEGRYREKIPPGYRDDKKDVAFFYSGVYYQSRYSDLIVWKQIIDYAKDINGRPIVFVTDDDKSDWWWIVESNGKKQQGPRPELAAEIKQISGTSFFYMYNSERFLDNAKNYLSARISRETIEEVKYVSGDELVGSDYKSNKIHSRIAQYIPGWIQGNYQNSDYKSFSSNGSKWPRYTLVGGSKGDLAADIIIADDLPRLQAALAEFFVRASRDVQNGLFNQFDIYVVLTKIKDNIDALDSILYGNTLVPEGVRAFVVEPLEASDGSLTFYQYGQM